MEVRRLTDRGARLIGYDYCHKYDNKLSILFLFLIFIGIFLLNYLQPIFNDDWIYSFKVEAGFPDHENHTKIQSLSDFISSQYIHYHIWGGRTVAHIFVQALLLLDAPLRALLNSLVFVSLVYLVCRIANPVERKGLLYALVALMLWFLQPGFAASVLWITGSGNYLWTFVIILCFIYPFAKSYLKSDYSRKSVLFSISLFFVGVLAGWTNENIAVSISLCGFLYLIYLWKQKTKIPFWMIVGFVGFLIGTLFLIFAPGNKLRMESEVTLHNIDTGNYLLYLIKRFKAVLLSCYHDGLPSMFLYAIMLATHRFYRKEDVDNKKRDLSIFFFILAITSLLVMTVSPAFPPRAWFGTMTFIIIAIALLYTEIDFSKFLPVRVYYNIAIIFFVTLFVGQYYLAAKDLNQIRNVFSVRERIVEEEKTKGNLDVVFHNQLRLESSFPHTSDLESSAQNWKNELYSIYHGLNSVRVIPPEESDIDKKEQ